MLDDIQRAEADLAEAKRTSQDARVALHEATDYLVKCERYEAMCEINLRLARQRTLLAKEGHHA